MAIPADSFVMTKSIDLCVRDITVRNVQKGPVRTLQGVETRLIFFGAISWHVWSHVCFGNKELFGAVSFCRGAAQTVMSTLQYTLLRWLQARYDESVCKRQALRGSFLAMSFCRLGACIWLATLQHVSSMLCIKCSVRIYCVAGSLCSADAGNDLQQLKVELLVLD